MIWEIRGVFSPVLAVVASLALVWTAGCGTDNAGPMPAPVSGTSGFTLTVLPDCLVGGASVEEFTLDTLKREDETLVSISAVSAENLKALYFELGYDADKYNPLEVNHLAPDNTDLELITLDVLEDRGKVHGGQVLANWDKAPGFTGDAVLATVRFLNGPAPALKISSAAPTSPASASIANYDMENDSLAWDFASQGDYDQNSEVNIADLTPLGLFFREAGDFARSDVRSQVDGDSNGEINIADVTQIGANFLNQVGSWNVYGAPTDDAYPAAPDDPSTIAPLANVLHSAKQGNPAAERLTFSFSLDGQTMVYYWVRPVAGEEEGISSNLVMRGDLPGALLELASDPDYGNGTELDPYYIDVETDYILTVTLPGEIDASVDPLTAYAVSDAAAGAVDKGGAQAVFNVDDAFTGLVHVSGEYDGEPTVPEALYFRVIDPAAPLLQLLNDPDAGIGSADDPYIVDVTTTYSFGLFSLLAGNVAGDALTTWNVSDPAAGSVVKGATQASLNIDDGYAGTFNVGAVYDGSPSDPLVLHLRVPAADSPALTLETPAQGGSGYEWDPYLVDNFVDYSLRLLHPTSGEVGADANTVWTVSDPLAGTVNTGGASGVLELNAGYEGLTSVGATYNGAASIPALLWFDVVDTTGATPPTASYLIRETVSGINVSGSETSTELELTFDASGSTDPDGTVEYYSYDFYGSGDWYIEESASPTMNHTYYTTGVFDTRVMVRDDDGAVDIATVQLTVTDGGNFWPEVSMTAAPTSAEVPVTVNFDASASWDDVGIVQFTWDLDGDGLYETDTGDTPTTSHLYTEDGIYLVGVKGYDAESAWDFDEAELTLTLPGGNLSPVASLSAAPVFGPPGMNVDFNAGDSSDPDGDTITFEWDFDGDGTYDESTGTTPTTSHIYDTAGTFQATVKVTDPSAAFDTASVTITVESGEGEWHIYTVIDPDGATVLNAGENCNLKVVDGLPAIAYQDTITAGENVKKRVMYVRALDANGDTWDAPVQIREPQLEQEASGLDIDLEIVDGQPAVCFSEREWSTNWNMALHYARATDAAGTAWGASLVLDGNGAESAGRYCDLDIAEGNPAVAYFNATDTNLSYTRASDATGSAWGAPVQIEALTSGSPSGVDTSLAIVNGNPAVAYMYWMSDVNEDQLHYTRATNAEGSAWGVPVIVDNHNNVGFYNHLLVHGGVPVLSTCSYDESEAWYFTADDATGSSWGDPVVAVHDEAGGFGGPTAASMAIYNGKPVISYVLESDFNSYVKFVRSTAEDGSSWQSAETLEGIFMFPAKTSCAIVNGNPAVAYGGEVDNGDGMEGSLRYAVWY